jgi:tetratricopeptide (TPR) repeat protein
VQQLRSLLEVGGPHYAAYLNLAIALRALGRSADALLVLDEAEGVRPGQARTSLVRGVTLLGTGELAAASASLAQHRERLGATPPTAESYYYGALASLLLGAQGEADTLLDEGLSLHGSSAPLLLLAGLVLEERGDLDAAEQQYRRAVEEDPQLPQAHKALGDAAFRRGAHGEAQRSYARVIELAPDFSDDVYARIGDLYFRHGETRAAREAWEWALRLNPANMQVRSNLELATHAAV